MPNTPAVVTLLLVGLLLPCAAAAQAQVVREDPVPMVIAMSGVVVVSAGFGLMLHASRGRTCDCVAPHTGELAGGVVVVAAGVTMVYLGLRARRVVIAPTQHGMGATATMRWGGARTGRGR